MQIHKIQVPLHLAEHYGRGDKKRFNSYCRAYFLGNHPEFIPVQVDGKKQDIHAQKGIVHAIYRPGMAPKNLLERAAANKKKKRG